MNLFIRVAENILMAMSQSAGLTPPHFQVVDGDVLGADDAEPGHENEGQQRGGGDGDRLRAPVRRHDEHRVRAFPCLNNRKIRTTRGNN